MNIGERIALIREKEKLNQEDFGKRINVTRSAVSNYEKGTRNVMDRVISDICREFNVNENWLRTGEGNMFDDLSKAELVANIVGNALKTDDEFVQNIFIALGKMSPEQWDKVKQFIKDIK